jgi:hypothetical protein
MLVGNITGLGFLRGEADTPLHYIVVPSSDLPQVAKAVFEHMDNRPNVILQGGELPIRTYRLLLVGLLERNDNMKREGTSQVFQPFHIPFNLSFAQRYFRCCSERLPSRRQWRAWQGSKVGDELKTAALAVLDKLYESLFSVNSSVLTD